MSLYGILGLVEFEVVTSPERFDARRRYSFARHEVVEGRPQLQWVGDDLETIELTLRFHIAFTNPMLQVLALHTLAETHIPWPLVFSNGVYRGRYVIEEISERWDKTADDGSVICSEVTVSLEEWPPTLVERIISLATQAGASIGQAFSSSKQRGRSVLSGSPVPVPVTGLLSDVSNPSSSNFIAPHEAVRLAA